MPGKRGQGSYSEIPHLNYTIGCLNSTVHRLEAELEHEKFQQRHLHRESLIKETQVQNLRKQTRRLKDEVEVLGSENERLQGQLMEEETETKESQRRLRNTRSKLRQAHERIAGLEQTIALLSQPGPAAPTTGPRTAAVAQRTRAVDITCSICLEPVGPAESGPVRKLPCHHLLHQACLDDIVTSGLDTRCPLCRTQW
jgi:DNA repair exonuclease SbcCD ATPase subunit